MSDSYSIAILEVIQHTSAATGGRVTCKCCGYTTEKHLDILVTCKHRFGCSLGVVMAAVNDARTITEQLNQLADALVAAAAHTDSSTWLGDSDRRKFLNNLKLAREIIATRETG